LTVVAAYFFLTARAEWPFSRRVTCAALMCLVFLTPLPALVFVGMEHALHVFLTVIFLFLIGRALAEGETRVPWWLVLIVVGSLMGTRYESAFLVMWACALALCRRRWRVLAACTGGALAPILLYGFISVAKGGYFFPNPVLIKGTAQGSVHLSQILHAPHVLVLIVAAAAILAARLWHRGSLKNCTSNMLFVFIGGGTMHMIFARAGWFYRYEAYVVAAGIFTLSMAYLGSALRFPNPENAADDKVKRLDDWRRLYVDLGVAAVVTGLLFNETLLARAFSLHGHIESQFSVYFIRFIQAGAIATGIGLLLPIRALVAFKRRALHKVQQEWPQVPYLLFAALGALLMAPLLHRGLRSLKKIPQATANIYQQQYQMGLFLKTFYNGQSIAANDIGAINYFSDIECIDLFGSATMAAARAKLHRSYSTATVRNVVRNRKCRIAILYEHWFDGEEGPKLPSTWIECGQWTIKGNLVCGGETITFYAIQPNERDALLRSLRAYAPKLPRSVLQTGQYALPTVNGVR